MVPADFGYARAAERLRALLAAGVPVGAVLAGGDEGVLIFNRLSTPVPVIDQVDLAAVAGCDLVAVEVRPPGDPLTLLADPVAMAAAFSLPAGEAGDAAVLCRTLVDFSNAVVGRAGPDGAGPGAGPGAESSAEPGPRQEHRPGDDGGPWVVAAGKRVTLRSACALVPGWPVGTVRTLGTGDGPVEVDDLFALDLAEVADTATARRGRLGSAALVASLRGMTDGADHAAVLADLLGLPVHGMLSEPAAARLGTLTTPGSAARCRRGGPRRGHGGCDRAGRRGDRRGRRGLAHHRGRGDPADTARRGGLGQARPVPAGRRRPTVRSRRREPRFPGPARAGHGGGDARRAGAGRAASIRPGAQPGRVAGDTAAAQGGRVRREPAPGPAHARRPAAPGTAGRRPGRG